MSKWSYWKPETGPEQWQAHFPAAGGVRQSPINITSDITMYDPSLADGRFVFTYHPYDCTQITNKGTTWSITVKEDSFSTLTAVHLPGTYKLIDVHGHWGNDPTCGSEHLIAGEGYAAEIHIVHMNTKYKDAAEAKTFGDGLAVLGILVKEGEYDNPALAPLVKHMKEVPFKGDTAHLIDGFYLNQLIPMSKDFWTYEGSLTTPPCSECVIWTVFRSVLTASKSQLDTFRSLHSVREQKKEQDFKIVNNYRAPQPVGERTIRASFVS